MNKVFKTSLTAALLSVFVFSLAFPSGRAISPISAIPVAHAAGCAIGTAIDNNVSDLIPSVGETITYTLSGVASNIADPTMVTVNDALSADLTFVSSTANIGSYSSSTGVWDLGTITSSTAMPVSLQISAKVNAGSEGEVIDNEPSINYSQSVGTPCAQSDAINGISMTVQGTPVPPSADLAVTKNVDVATTTPGTTVHYTVVVKDNGPATSTGATATDILPAGLIFRNATASVGNYATSTGIWTIGDLAPSSTATLVYAAEVDPSIIATTTIINTVSVSESASTTDPVAGNNTASVGFLVVPNATTTPVTPTSTPTSTATIVATKIICPSLSDLPDLAGTGATITSSTAADFIAAHPECHLASGWDFQWAPVTAVDPNVGGNFIGPAPTSTGWNTFGPTDASGQATGTITNPTSSPSFWVREVIQPGYEPFSFYPGHTVNSTSSPEMFCHTDVTNYDDYDGVDGPVSGGTYYCVAWNVPATSTPVAPSADIGIVKTVDNANPAVGDTINYTLTATAYGPATSTGVVATDTLPSGITYVSATSSEGSYASSTGTWTIGDMSASSTATLRITATVNSGTENDVITNTGLIGESASTTDPNLANNSSSVSVTVQGGGGCSGSCGGGTDADIAIVKTANVTSTLVGGAINYTLTVTDHGPATSTDVVATDILPSGLSFQNATETPGTSYATSTGVWTIGTLGPNATATLQIATLVTGPGVSTGGSTNSTITNTATVTESSTLTDTDLSNNSSSVSVLIGPALPPTDSDMAVLKTVDNASPTPGTTVNFTVVMTDNGPATSTFVHVQDQLPSGLLFVSATTSQGSYNMSTGDWDIETVSPNATATLLMAAEVDPGATPGTTITNTAHVYSTLASLVDPDLTNNTSSVTLTVQSAGCTSSCGGGGGGGGGSVQANIGIVKTVDNANPATGAVVHYTLTVTDGGPSDSFGVVASDTLPSGLTFDSASSSEGSYDSSTGIWTIGAVNDGQSATLVITATVTAAAGTTITNVGTVSENPGILNATPGNTSSSVSITVAGGNGGGGGGGGGPVLGASTSTGQVLGASCGLYLTSYIHPIRKDLNDPTEVKKLQTFLNQNLGLSIPVTGYYGDQTIAAVNQFQVKYHIEVLAPWVPLGLPTQFTPTSYVYQTTQRWINLIMCPPLNLPLPALKVDNGE